MLTTIKTVLVATVMAMLAQGSQSLANDQPPEVVVAGFEKRVDQMFRAESGKPLKRAKKNPPLKPGRGNYVRGYSYSMVGYAARCLYLNEALEEANAALAENAQHYLDNPKDINDRDSFHWHASEVLRLIEMYGTVEGLSVGDQLRGDQFLSGAGECVGIAAQVSRDGSIAVVAQALGVGDDDQEEVERPGVVGAAGQEVIAYQALVDPTELRGYLASLLRPEESFDDAHEWALAFVLAGPGV